jgi:Ser/Thr protein kinase RdoA (MazF antagonist)
MNDDHRSLGSFDALTPDVVVQAVEQSYGVKLDGTVEPYPSYINRVYGIRTDDGTPLIVKFYRPGRWSDEAILDEHQFLLDLDYAEVPAIPPILSPEETTLHEAAVGDNQSYRYALFRKQGGRSFEGESDDDLRRLGAVVGRCHAVGRSAPAANRLTLRPETTTVPFAHELVESGTVHPSVRDEFLALVDQMVSAWSGAFAQCETFRIHGDCHRGNVLSRDAEGLVLIDFDDMMIGPAVQDLWMLLPERLDESRREFNLILEGYEQFREFDFRNAELVEPLRFMRMVYFLTWQARQRHDYWFTEHYPGWGGEAFWIKELEDLRLQARYIL